MGELTVVYDGRSGHLLHVVGSVALTELRDAQVLRGFIKLQNRTEQNTHTHTHTHTNRVQSKCFDSGSSRNGCEHHLVTEIGSLDGNFLDLLTNAQLTLGEVGPMAGTNRNRKRFKPTMCGHMGFFLPDRHRFQFTSVILNLQRL